MTTRRRAIVTVGVLIAGLALPSLGAGAADLRLADVRRRDGQPGECRVLDGRSWHAWHVLRQQRRRGIGPVLHGLAADPGHRGGRPRDRWAHDDPSGSDDAEPCDADRRRSVAIARPCRRMALTRCPSRTRSPNTTRRAARRRSPAATRRRAGWATSAACRAVRRPSRCRRPIRRCCARRRASRTRRRWRRCRAMSQTPWRTAAAG